MPTGGRPCPFASSLRTAARITAIAALLSAPRIASLRLRRTPSTSSTCTGASSGTVSRWAQRRIVRASSEGAGRRASRLPAFDPVSAAVASSLTSRPSARSSAVTTSATARSLRDTLSISHSRTNSLTSCSTSPLTAWTLARDLLAHVGRGGRRLRRCAHDRGLVLRRVLARALERRAHELAEQRLRTLRARLELRVVLRGDEERVVGMLDHLDEAVVRRGAAAHEAGVLEPAAQVVVHLVAVTVALVDHLLAVDLLRARAVVELHRVRAEAHGAAHVAHLLLLRQEVDHGVRRLGVELGRVGAVETCDVARELGHRDLHAEADPEVWHAALPSEPRGPDLALDAAHAEATGDQDPVALLELALCLLAVDRLGVDPAHLDLAVVVRARVAERLDHRQVRVLELDVLPDEPDLHGRV